MSVFKHFQEPWTMSISFKYFQGTPGTTGTPPAADWKRPPGRPRRNWLQQVVEDVGLSVGAAWIAGQDRSMWRTLRPSAGQAQQWVSEWLSRKSGHPELIKQMMFCVPSSMRCCPTGSSVLWSYADQGSYGPLTRAEPPAHTLKHSQTYTPPCTVVTSTRINIYVAVMSQVSALEMNQLYTVVHKKQDIT